MPISLNGEDISYLGDEFRIKANEVGGIESLMADDEYLIGGPTKLKVVILYLLSGIFVVLGVCGLGVTLLAFMQTYVQFQRTGKFPDLPNSIDSKVEGWKFIFRGFKEKE